MADATAGPMRAPDQASADLTRGLLMMAVAMAVMPLANALAKLLFEALSPGQVAWGRFAFQALFIAPFLLLAEGWRGFIPHRFWANAARGGLIAAANLAFYVSLNYMALAEALAIFFVSPLIVVALSAVFEREPVAWRDKGAVAAGLIGALLVIRPSYQAIGAVALLPLCSAAAIALYFHLNRLMRRHDSALSMQFSASFFGTLAASAALAVGFAAGQPNLAPSLPALNGWLVLAAIGAIASVGQFLIVQASRFAPPSRIAPLQYLEIVGATALGYLFFGEWLDPLTWLGIAIIVGSGLYVFVVRRG